jgi:hypothetical protein
MEIRFSCPYGRSLANPPQSLTAIAPPARRSGPESSTPQNIEHAAQRISVHLGIGANPLSITGINFDQACLLRCRPGRTRRLFCRRSLQRGGWTRRGEMDWNQTRSRRLAKLLRYRLAPPDKDQTWSDPIPLRQPQTSLERSSSCRPQTNGAVACRSPKSQPASTC